MLKQLENFIVYQKFTTVYAKSQREGMIKIATFEVTRGLQNVHSQNNLQIHHVVATERRSNRIEKII